MFDLNLQSTLKKDRDKIISSQELNAIVEKIFNEKAITISHVKRKLNKPNDSYINSLTFDNIDTDKIFHVSSIKELCIKYRLRFLDTHLFKGEYPSELYSLSLIHI